LTLTLRRTGGTSLQSFLAQVSPFKSVEHEPFNEGRLWGHVVSQFQEDNDLVALEARIDSLLSQKVNIKHCIEVVPPQVTRLLINCAKKHGYFFIVLTRRNSIRRLRSLFLASATGAWGPEQEARRYAAIRSGELKLQAIDLDQVRRQYWSDQQALGRIVSQLRYLNIDYEWLVYEEVYQGELPVSAHAARLVDRIGLDLAGETQSLNKLNARGKQSSQSIEDCVPNYAAMMKTLQEICVD
jgi:hypothetical protein